MKKIFSLLIISIMFFSCATVNSTFASGQNPMFNSQNTVSDKAQRKREFEQRLNLSEVQKEKARELHQAGREQIRPIFIKIELKRQEIETVKLTRISVQAQEERIKQLQQEISELEKQAQEIRKKNSQEFEKILDKNQKNEFAKMKAEGRLKYEQSHKARPLFQGLGTPNFLLRPLLPPNNINNIDK